MAMRAKSFHLESWLLGAFWKYPHCRNSPFPPLHYFSPRHTPVYFLDITLSVKCAQFTGCNDAFAATGIQGRFPWRQSQWEEWAQNQGQVAEGDTGFLLISWNQLFWRSVPKIQPGCIPFHWHYHIFFFLRWYFNFLLYSGKDNGDSPSPRVQWNKVGIFQKEHLLGN